MYYNFAGWLADWLDTVNACLDAGRRNQSGMGERGGDGAESYERDGGDFRNAGTLITALIDRRKHRERPEM
jgi:hypothetical protein